jgi:hypothetical protein
MEQKKGGRNYIGCVGPVGVRHCLCFALCFHFASGFLPFFEQPRPFLGAFFALQNFLPTATQRFAKLERATYLYCVNQFALTHCLRLGFPLLVLQSFTCEFKS